MWELDYKESWALKNWCFWTVVLEKTLESSLDCKEIQPVHPKGDQSWIVIGRTDAEAEIPNFGHLMWRADSLEKTLMLGKIKGRRRRGWPRMRWLDGITDAVDMGLGGLWELVDGQGGLVCCSSRGCKQLDTTEWQKWTELNWTARRSNQSILKEINPEYSLEGLMQSLKLQYFGHLMWRADSFEKTLMLGKIEGERRRGWQTMRWLAGITDVMDMSLGKLQE